MQLELSTDDIFYRRAVVEDVSEMADVYYTSLADMALRMNRPKPEIDNSTNEKFYIYAMSNGDFFVATSNERIVGFAGSSVRDHIWYLSSFWVLPSFQRKGIGFPIVHRVHNSGKERGCSVFCVYSSNDYPAVSSYMKLGMYPGYPVFSYEKKDDLSQEFSLKDSFKVEALSNETEISLDKKIRGVKREQDHNYWKSIGFKSFQIQKKDEIIGYYYFKDGFIGPLVSRKSKNTELLIKSAINDINKSNADKAITIMVPGINQIALKVMIELGFRIRGSAYFFYSKEFGKLENYIPSGPGLY